MPEEERLSHLMKGVAEEVYRYLLPRDIATTDQFIAECRRVVALQGRRVTASKFERLPNVTSLGDLGDVTDLQSLIRQITRKFPWSQCYKTSQPVSSAFTIGKLRAAPSNGGEAAAQPIIPPLSTVVKMTNNYIDIKVEGDTIRALVDSGASYSVISERFRVELKKTMFAETDVVLKVADDKVVKSKGRCTLKLEVNGHPENFEFVVLENCSHDVILGWDFFKATNAVIDCGLGELQLDDLPDLDVEGRDDGVYAIQDFVIPGRSSQRISVLNRSLVGIVNMEVTCSKELFIRKDVIFPSSLIEFEEGIGKIWITNGGLQPQMIPKGMNLGRMCDIETEHVCLLSVEPESFSRERREDDHSDYLLSLINPDLPKKKKEDLMGLLLSFKGVFLPTMKNANKVQNRVKHRIHTGDHPPIKQRPYRVSKREREIMQKEVDTMLERKVIQPSESPWSAPVVLVKKKDGTWRFCVDFRRLNHITKKDVYPLPRIDDVLDHLSSARYYSTMDLKTGYWQVEVDERDREKTAFVTPDGLYEFMVMPFGLCNAPATFERMMDNVLMGLKWNICLCYLDDIVVYSDTFEEHLERLSKVLSCLQQAGLTINPDKCLFGSTRIKILGHVVDKDGIQPDSEKVEAIKKFPVPKSVCDIQSYLGLCSYYRRFIKNFSKIAAPLQILLKKDQKFIWTQEQKDSFESLKKALMQKPVLGHFKESAITKLHTDASSYGLGAVLVQIQENQENPIAYASRTLSKAEKNYSTTERECLAVIWAIGKFRPYLYGRPFEVVSDHHSLCWLAGLKDPSGRLARWALKLQDFDATITYKSGVKHKDADCLSRYPLPESPALTSLTLVREQQNLDPDITKISNALNQGEGAERFEMKNGLLYKRNFDPLGRRLLLVIPKCMRPDILKEFHDVPTAGHLGFARTYDRIRKKYFGPYKITRKVSEVNYEVEALEQSSRRRRRSQKDVVHVLRMKPYRDPGQQLVTGDYNSWDSEDAVDILEGELPRSTELVPERPSTGSQPGEEFSPKNQIMKNLKENSSENQNNANSPAGDMHVNLAAARGDVTAPKTAASTSATPASPASLNWADSEMAEVDANDDYTVVKSKKRRHSSTPEHVAKQPGRPAEKPSSQQKKRPTGPRSMPPQEIKATRANIAAAKARQATTNHENYIFVELCPDIPDYSYLKAIGMLVGGPGRISQFNRMNGHYVVGLATKDHASRLVEVGLVIEGTHLKVFPFRKRAERIVKLTSCTKPSRPRAQTPTPPSARPSRRPGSSCVAYSANEPPRRHHQRARARHSGEEPCPLSSPQTTSRGHRVCPGDKRISSGQRPRPLPRLQRCRIGPSRSHLGIRTRLRLRARRSRDTTARPGSGPLVIIIVGCPRRSSGPGRAGRRGHPVRRRPPAHQSRHARRPSRIEPPGPDTRPCWNPGSRVHLRDQPLPPLGPPPRAAPGLRRKRRTLQHRHGAAATSPGVDHRRGQCHRLTRGHRLPISSRRRLRTGGDRLRSIQAGLRSWREPPEERWPLVRRLAQPRRLPSRRLLVDHLHQGPRARHRPQEHRRPPGAASPGPPGDCMPQMDALHPRPLPRRASKSGEHAGGLYHPAPPAWLPTITPDHRQAAGPTGEIRLGTGPHGVASRRCHGEASCHRRPRPPRPRDPAPARLPQGGAGRAPRGKKCLQLAGRRQQRGSLDPPSTGRHPSPAPPSPAAEAMGGGLQHPGPQPPGGPHGSAAGPPHHRRLPVVGALENSLPNKQIVEALTAGVTYDLKKIIYTRNPQTPEEWLDYVNTIQKWPVTSARGQPTPQRDLDRWRPESTPSPGQGHYQPQYGQAAFRRPGDPFKVPTLHIQPVQIKPNTDRVIRLRPYRIPFTYRKEIDIQINEMLKNNIIEPAIGEYASPITLVKKKNGTFRMCVDFRKLNEHIPVDPQPIPLIESVIEKLSKAKYFSSLDLSNAYWTVPIHPDSRPYLAFTTHAGVYMFKILPFGLRSSPQIFERAIGQILRKYNFQFLEHYYDDFMIFSDSFEEHLEHIRLFFQLCRAENIRLNLNKCQLCKTSINFLGYEITQGTYKPHLTNTQVIGTIQPPTNVKTLQSFLGVANVYHKFIPHYAQLRSPLYILLKKNIPFKWTLECQKAFEDLKSSLTASPVLHIFKEDLPCFLYCDASTLGISGILKQKDENGEEHPVQYFSRSLRKYEQNYSISELECLAIIESIEYFRVYLLGRHFTIYSDHQALVYLKNIKNPSGRLFRWSLRLSPYTFDIHYLKGKKQLEANLLSRQPFCGFLEAQQLEEHQHRVPEKYQSLINTDGLAIITKKGVPRVVVPDTLRNKLLQKAHEWYNHPGITQLTRLITSQYYWDGMTKDINNYVRKCKICQIVKPPKGPTYGEMGTLPLAKEPYELMSMDTVAGFNKYGGNRAYLHVICDHMSRYCWTFPSKSTSTLTYIQILERVFQEGDLALVKVYRHPNTPKLEPNYTGPYEILEILSPQVVRINRPNRPLQLQTEIINIEKLRRYVENIPHITPPTDLPDSPPRQNYFLFPYRRFTTDILGDPGSSRPRKWFQPFNHLDNSIFTDEKFYKPDFPITSKPTFSSIVKPTKSSTLVLDPKINPFDNMGENNSYTLQHGAADKSIELKQINSTLSRMEGIKPPAEFVPYSNEKKWETWRESFEIFAIAVNLESMPLVRQRAILKHIAGEKTVIYKTFHISENDTYPNVKEMLDMLTNHFKPFKNTIQRRNAFFTCVQKEKQGIMEFVTELKHLAQECEFENLTESLIRDRLIIGILDREVKRKLLEDPQLTLPRAISIAVISESTCSQVASLNEQKMIEKIEKRNWVKDTIRMENAEAGPSVVCRTKRIRNLLAESEAEESCDEINLNEVAVKTVRSDKWSAVIIINGKKTTVHLDTGAQINVLPHKVINQWPSRPEIRPTSLKAFAYGNTELPIVGKCNVLCQYGEKKGMFEFIVADVEAQTLITGDTCERLEILRRINHINTDEMKLCSETQKILEQYHEVFQGVGLINSECKIYTKPEYSPVQVPPRRIPTSLGAEVQSELEKMVKQGIVTKIYHETEWSHPMVVVKKKSGQIRICLDPRKLNEALVGRHFQTPAPAELLHEIPKAKYYTVLDVKSAYWHIPVAKECRDLLVMTTPFGKFRYNRLPFGLKISAQIFVEKMTNIFRDSFQNITYVDDLLIYADTIQEHNKKLKGILEKAKEKNIKFDLTKAQICLTKVRFLGHVISQNGIDPEPNKIDKLITFKRPEDKKSLQRIMGLYNYLGKFIPNLAASTSNIRGILRKNVVWHWGPKQDGEFDHIKECVRNAPSLAHFDKSKMLILQCDASKDAMGAALLQEDRPLAFASASFSDSQKQYSQIEKELLSVYYGCKKFEYLLSGHTFVVQTDHQPLLPLVKKPLSDISPRLQRLVMKLIAFDFKLQYKPGKYLIVADTLSRDTHPMDELPTPFLEDKRMVKMVRVNISDEKLVAMQKDTREDPALVKVIDYVIEGWPICKKDVDEDAKVFFDFRHRLYLWNDLLCIGSAIVIPKTQRNAMLNLLHQSHQGISAIQGLARESLFWPRMSIDIAEKVKNCEICQKHQKSKIRQPLKPFPVPDYPWQTVSLDIFYIQKKPHLLVVDRYSGYPEVFTLDPPTAINVKNKLRETFARFGIPETMMSDNGPPFRSEIMTDFCIRWGIKQLFSSPHLHRSNGLAERNIQTIKNQLIKCRDEGSDPYLAILAYRNTPKNDLPSPAQLCLSRSLRCQIPRITPLYRPYQTNWRSIENAKRKRQSSMKEQYDRNSKSYPKVNVGEDAWCQIHPRETWTPVKISAQADSPQSFEVVTPSGNRLIRNQQFIRPRDGGYEKSQLSSEPITASPEAQHPQCYSPTMGESSTAPIQRSSEETNIDQREGATTSAGIAPEPSGRPRFS
ncbi:K02A2.6-like, partial [Cordylochernes scorpioides]